MRTLLVTALLFSFYYSSWSESRVDSVDYYILETKKILFRNVDSALIYINQTQRIVEANQTPLNQGKLYGILGIFNDVKGAIDSAVLYYDSAIIEYKKVDATLALANVYNNAGFAHYKLGDLDKSSNYYHQAILEYQETGSIDKMARTYNNLGLVYMQIKDYQKAIECFDLSMEKSDEVGDHDNFHFSLAGKAEVLLLIGRSEESVELFAKSVEYMRTLDKPYYLSKTLNNYAQSLHNIKKYDLAEEAFKECLELKKVFWDEHSVYYTYSSLSWLYLETNQILLAEAYADSTYQLAEDLSVTEKMNAYLLKANIAEEKGQFQLASELYNQYIFWVDSTNAVDQAERIKKLNNKYEVAKKDKEIAELALENEISQRELLESRVKFYGLGGLLLLVITFALIYLYSLRKQHRLSKALLHEEISGLRLRIGKIMSDIKLEEVTLDSDKLQNDLPNTLTEREVQILQVAITNKTNSEIADEVHLSVNTVKYHLKNIYNKLGVSTRLEAREALSQIN